MTRSLLLIPRWIPWVAKYISYSLISWVDSLEWQVVAYSLLLIPRWIPWVAKYISCSLISWVDSLEWRVRGFLSLGGFL